MFDLKTYHEISRVLDNIKGLQQKPGRPDLKFCNLLVTPINREPEVGVELPREYGILRGYKCLEIGYDSDARALPLGMLRIASR